MNEFLETKILIILYSMAAFLNVQTALNHARIKDLRKRNVSKSILMFISEFLNNMVISVLLGGVFIWKRVAIGTS